MNIIASFDAVTYKNGKGTLTFNITEPDQLARVPELYDLCDQDVNLTILNRQMSIDFSTGEVD